MQITQSLHEGLDRELRAADMRDAVRLKNAYLDGDRGLPGRARHQAFQDECGDDATAARIELHVHLGGVCQVNK